jgi:hypothetical protein
MKYTIELYGYGSEITIGKPNEKEINLLINSDESISYTVNNDFLERSWYDIDDILHVYGSSFESATLTIKDENDNVVCEFDSDSGFYHKDSDEELVEYREVDIDESEPLLMSVSHEKGLFFSGEFETENFDVEKLKICVISDIGIENFYYGDIIESIKYDDEVIENYDTSTSGKSFDAYVNFTKATIRNKKIDQIL